MKYLAKWVRDNDHDPIVSAEVIVEDSTNGLDIVRKFMEAYGEENFPGLHMDEFTELAAP